MSNRRLATAFLAASLLFAFVVGTADAAGRPTRQYAFTECWDGSSLQMAQSWSGFTVDEYSFGSGDGQGSGFGFSTPIHPSRHGTVTSSGLAVDDSSLVAGGDLRFRGQIVESVQINQPTGGWESEPACP